MTTFNKQEYNKLCVYFLNLNRDEFCVIYKYQSYSWDMLRFDEDWNWIMEVVEKIENTKKDNEWYVDYIWLSSTNISFSVRGWRDGSVLFQTLGRFYNVKTKKEAVAQAIYNFLIWYNENSTGIK